MEISKERLGILNSDVSVTDLIDAQGVPCGTQVEIIIYNYKNKNR